jgi:hypothetical protein
MGLIQTNGENGNGGRAVAFVARRLPRAVPGMLRARPRYALAAFAARLVLLSVHRLAEAGRGLFCGRINRRAQARGLNSYLAQTMNGRKLSRGVLWKCQHLALAALDQRADVVRPHAERGLDRALVCRAVVHADNSAAMSAVVV